MIAASRRQYILDQLDQKGSVQIQELSQELGISTMTVHRDLDQLAADGHLQKVRGGAVARQIARAEEDECPTCHGPIHRRNPMILHLQNGTHRQTCCAHCGLMALASSPAEFNAALATDFLYGRTVNAQSATYIVSPRITVCCTPTILAFERRADADSFQQGFGGQLMSMKSAIEFLRMDNRL